MKNQDQSQAIAAMIKTNIEALTAEELEQIDEGGARFYILTNEDCQPFFYIFHGNPINSIYHEWAANHGGPGAHVDLECWQGTKTPVEELREAMNADLDRICESLIDDYMISVSNSCE